MTEPLRDIEDIAASYVSKYERAAKVLSKLVCSYGKIKLVAISLQKLTGVDELNKDAEIIKESAQDIAEILDGIKKDISDISQIQIKALYITEKTLKEKYQK